jgi:hypothetical protein
VKLKLAKEKATQVLDEELEAPTVKYVAVGPPFAQHPGGVLSFSGAALFGF